MAGLFGEVSGLLPEEAPLLGYIGGKKSRDENKKQNHPGGGCRLERKLWAKDDSFTRSIIYTLLPSQVAALWPPT